MVSIETTNEETRYAIRCETREQAEECNNNKLLRFTNIEFTLGKDYKEKGYTIISYDEAISLGLLGEKKNLYKEYPYYKDEHGDIIIPSRDEPQKVEPVKKCNHSDKCICVHCGVNVRKSPSEDIVEKILEDMHSNMSKVEIRSILKKHLSI